MPIPVIMPAFGVVQQSGTLLKWLKTEGQPVAKGEPLMEVETDKATVEIEAPRSGILTQVTAKPGDQVPVGQRIAYILAPGEAAPLETVPAGRRASLPKEEKNQPTPTAKVAATAVPRIAPSIGRLLASPAAKKIAREKGVELASLQGSGPEGSVLVRDVLRALADTLPPDSAASNAHEVVPLTPMRRIIGERMAQSKHTVPHFYLSMDIDMSAVINVRVEWKERSENQAPSLNDFILYVCARVLKDFRSLNATFTENGIELYSDINLGVAVALEEGLVVPVIRNADRLSLTALAAQSRQLVENAQTKKLLPLDYKGVTFTVSNLGMFGVDSFTAIINPPQCAILAVGRVAERVVADNGMFAIKPLMTFTLSADHRVIDGAVGARFLQELKERLEKGAVDL